MWHEWISFLSLASQLERIHVLLPIRVPCEVMADVLRRISSSPIAYDSDPTCRKYYRSPLCVITYSSIYVNVKKRHHGPTRADRDSFWSTIEYFLSASLHENSYSSACIGIEKIVIGVHFVCYKIDVYVRRRVKPVSTCSNTFNLDVDEHCAYWMVYDQYFTMQVSQESLCLYVSMCTDCMSLPRNINFSGLLIFVNVILINFWEDSRVIRWHEVMFKWQSSVIEQHVISLFPILLRANIDFVWNNIFETLPTLFYFFYDFKVRLLFFETTPRNKRDGSLVCKDT